LINDTKLVEIIGTSESFMKNEFLQKLLNFTENVMHIKL